MWPPRRAPFRGRPRGRAFVIRTQGGYHNIGGGGYHTSPSMFQPSLFGNGKQKRDLLAT